MNAVDQQLFQWMAAGTHPIPWLLAWGRALALGGGWLAAMVLGWAAWKAPRQRPYLVAVLIGAGALTLLSHALASRLHVPRPFVLQLAPAYIAHRASGSLPSTHAAVMSMVALSLCFPVPLRRLGCLLLALAIGTGWARIYVGVHFPLDVLAGFALGAAAALLLLFACLAIRLLLARPSRIGRLARTMAWRSP